MLKDLSECTSFKPFVNLRSHALSIVAQIEGGIMLMKNDRDLKTLEEVVSVIRSQLELKKV
ncbi:hypothetical protein ACQCVE_16165 [Metabacillus sp. 113a]|uniref:hypothetical protein n=1 Tax=Metabacillus sp. 113a TaxID=3404706 RepID=UPI003CEC6BC8